MDRLPRTAATFARAPEKLTRARPASSDAEPRQSGHAADDARSKPIEAPACARRVAAVPPFDTYPAIAIEDVQPELDGGQWPIKRVVGDIVEVSADIFKEGHDLLFRRALIYRAARSAATWHEDADAAGRERSLGGHVQRRPEHALRVRRAGVHRRVRLLARRLSEAAGRAARTCRPSCSKGCDWSKKPSSAARDPADRGRLQAYVELWRSLHGPGRPARGGRAGDFGRARRRHGSLARSRRRDPLSPRAAADRRPACRALRRLVRDLSALAGHRPDPQRDVPRSRGAPAGDRGDGLRHAVHDAHPPDRDDQAQGAQQQPGRRPERSRAARTPSAASAGGHEAIAPELGTLDDFLHFQDAARAARPGAGAGLRHQLLARPPVGHTSTRTGSITARTAPSNTPKTRPRSTRTSTRSTSARPTGRTCGPRCAMSSCCGPSAACACSGSTIRTPSRSPSGSGSSARSQSRLPGHHLPGRGVHAAQDDEGAGQARLHPELYVLHLAQHEVGAAGVPDRAHADARCASTSEATSSPTRPDILPHILQLGGRPAFRMRLVLAATLSSVYGIYNGFELVENRPRGDAGTTEYYQDSEMYQHKVWDWDRPGNIVEDVTRINQHPPRQSGAAAVRQPALLSVRQRPAAGVRQGHARPQQHHRVRRQPRSVLAAVGLGRRAAARLGHRRRPAVRHARSADATIASPGAAAPTGCGSTRTSSPRTSFGSKSRTTSGNLVEELQRGALVRRQEPTPSATCADRRPRGAG